MGRLTATELRILRLLGGLEDGTKHSLADLSRRFGVPEHRVRELASSALHKLDNESHADEER